MYYLLVYAQLTVLTPLLYGLIREHGTLHYAVTPCVLLAWELMAALGIDTPRIGVLFPTWLIYYLVGLEWEKWRELLVGCRRKVAAIAVVALAAQVAEGLIWNSLGDYNMATTQLRISNMVSSLAVIVLLMLEHDAAKDCLSSCGMLVRLGDLSFGVYLCHMAFVIVVMKLFSIIGVTGVLPSFVMWVLVVSLSAAFVSLCRRVLPGFALKLVGFI